jgi:copper(I)-binding protein
MWFRLPEIAIVAALLPSLCVPAQAAGRLESAQAWIRAAPPGAMMLAGYAELRNAGDAEVTVVGADSEAFGSVSLHESSEENGVERMRPLDRLRIAPGATVRLAPRGRHLMLMQPKRALKAGDTAMIRIATEPASAVSAGFIVRDDAP